MSIQRRTAFYDESGGVVRFWDWGLTQTTLGMMAEPFNANARYGLGPAIQFDPADEMVRIDIIAKASIDKHMLLLSGGSEQIHGGTLIPRDGR